MPRILKTDFLGLSAILAWLMLSVLALVQGDANLFQRLGTLGIASGILYFAFVRHSPAFPKIVQDRLVALRKYQHLNAQHIEGAYRNTTLVAFDLRRTREDLGLSPLEGLETFVSGTLAHTLNATPLNAGEIEAQFSLLDEDERNLNAKIEFQQRFSKMFEVWVVVVATLQTGFGDYLVNAFGRAP